MKIGYLKLIGLAIIAFGLAGCGQNAPEPSFDQSRASKAANIPIVNPADWPLVTRPKKDAVISEVSDRPDQTAEPGETPATLPAKVLHGAPFTSQAPYADWADERQQDGCEEAAILMASRWVQGQTLTKDEALAELLALAAFQQKHYGYSQDTSATATARLMQDYFKIMPEIKFDISIQDIKQELAAGNVVITPMNGQTLGNPNYRQPGPERHMLLIIGYDDKTREFITNDAGTRRGKGYRYGYDQLYNAIRDYPSGEHVKIVDQRTAMIVVGR